MPLINLQQFDTSINSRVPEGNTYSGGEAKIWDAVAGLGDRALNIFSDIAIKDRQQDIKQSAWEAQKNFEIKLTERSLEAKGRTDKNGKIIALDANGNQKRNASGFEYEVDGLGKPIGYAQYMEKVVNDSRNEINDTFGEDNDKKFYFDSLIKGTVDKTLIDSIITQNNLVESYTKESVMEAAKVGLDKVTKYNDPDFTGVMDEQYNSVVRQIRDIYAPINPIAAGKMEKDLQAEYGKLAMEKYLMHAAINPVVADDGLTKFVGLDIAFNPEVKKFAIEFLTNRYDEATANKIIENYTAKALEWNKAKTQQAIAEVSNEIGKDVGVKQDKDGNLIMDDININGKSPSEAEAQVVKELINNKLKEGNKFYEASSPTEKQNFIESLLKMGHGEQRKENFSKMAENWSRGRAVLSDPIGKEAWIKEAQNIFNDPANTMTDYDKLDYIFKAIDATMLKEAEVYLYTKGKTAFQQYKKSYNKRKFELAEELIPLTVGVDNYKKAIAKTPSIGYKFRNSTESALLNLQRRANVTLNTNPEKVLFESPEYTLFSQKAFTKDANGNLAPTPYFKALADYSKNRLNEIGTIKAKLNSNNVLPKAQLQEFMQEMQGMSPAQQVSVFEKMSAIDPMLTSRLMEQAVVQKKIDPSTAVLITNMSIGDSESARFMNERLIGLRNSVMASDEKELLKQFQSEGFLGLDVDYADLNKAIAEASGSSEVLNNMKEIARANGLPDEAIRNMFTQKDLMLLTADYINRNSIPDGSNRFTTFGSKVENALNRAVSEFLLTKGTLINTPNIKGFVSKNEIKNQHQVELNASQVTNQLVKQIKAKNFKIDMSAYEGTATGERLSKMGNLKDTQFVNDIMDDISFVSTDLSGKNKTMVLMYKENGTGKYYRLKLIGKDGKAFIPTLNDVKSLEEDSSEEVLNKILRRR